MEKINIAEILKNCPSGMELDCTIWNNVTLGGIDSGSSYPIEIKIKGDKTTVEYLTKFGEWNTNENSKCVIFPKGKTTWERFTPPCQFKDGDIIYTLLEGNLEFISIFKKTTGALVYCYVDLGTQLYVENMRELCKKNDIVSQRLATENEKLKLFDVIKDNGYKWNDKTKTLEKLIEPKFKVGDRIKKYKDVTSGIVTNISDDGSYKVEYQEGGISYVSPAYQDEYELAPNKFDINTLKPFESRVLVRSTDDDIWRPAIYGFTDSDRYYVVGGIYWKQCIPYEANKELLGTTNNPKEYGSE